MRLWPIADGLDLILLHRQPLLTDHVAQKGYLTLEELALVWMSIVAFVLEPLQHPVHQLGVLFCRLTVDEDVVDKDDHSLVQSIPQDPLHLPLKDSGSVLHTKWHAVRLIQSQRRSHCQDLLAGLFQRDLPEAFRQVHLAE